MHTLIKKVPVNYGLMFQILRFRVSLLRGEAPHRYIRSIGCKRSGSNVLRQLQLNDVIWLERPQASFYVRSVGSVIPEMNQIQVDWGQLQLTTLRP